MLLIGYFKICGVVNILNIKNFCPTSKSFRITSPSNKIRHLLTAQRRRSISSSARHQTSSRRHFGLQIHCSPDFNPVGNAAFLRVIPTRWRRGSFAYIFYVVFVYVLFVAAILWVKLSKTRHSRHLVGKSGWSYDKTYDTQSFVARGNMTTRGWTCHTRASSVKCRAKIEIFSQPYVRRSYSSVEVLIRPSPKCVVETVRITGLGYGKI